MTLAERPAKTGPTQRIVDLKERMLTGDGHEGQSYVLTGPEAISFHCVASAAVV